MPKPPAQPSRWLVRLTERLARLADHPGYTLLLAFLAALDAYVFFVPIEVLLLPAVWVHPKRWIPISLWVSVGSSLGAVSLSELIHVHGYPWVVKHMPHALHSRSWEHASHALQDYGGWALALISLSPFPQHPAVAIAGLMQLSAMTVLVSVLVGRTIKYLFVAYLAVYAPGKLKKLMPRLSSLRERGFGSKKESR